MKIATNTVVTVDYRLTNEDREEIDSSENGQAIVYLHGGDELIDALGGLLSDFVHQGRMKLADPRDYVPCYRVVNG